MNADRAWWEASTREGFTAKAQQRTAHWANTTPKPVRETLRYIEEYWAAEESRSVGMRRVVTYR
jgi:hypothetical protein